MGRFVGALLILLALTSCVAKYPDTIVGVTLGCATDSTPVIIDTITRFKSVIPTKSNPHYKDMHYKFMECTNKPDCLDSYPFYPTQLTLYIKERKYSYTFSLKPAYPNIKCGEHGYGVAVNFDMGKLDYSVKERTITLTSEINKWTRTFKYSYNKRDKILTLTSGVVKK